MLSSSEERPKKGTDDVLITRLLGCPLNMVNKTMAAWSQQPRMKKKLGICAAVAAAEALKNSIAATTRDRPSPPQKYTVSSDLGHIFDPFEKSHQTMSQQIEELLQQPVLQNNE